MLNVRWEKIDLCIPEHFIWDHVGVSLCLSSAPGAATNPGAAQELTAGITLVSGLEREGFSPSGSCPGSVAAI